MPPKKSFKKPYKGQAYKKPFKSAYKNTYVQISRPTKYGRKANPGEKKMVDCFGGAYCSNTAGVGDTTYNQRGWNALLGTADAGTSTINWYNQDNIEIDATGPTTRLLSGVAQGQTNITRVGNAYKLNFIKLRLQLMANADIQDKAYLAPEGSAGASPVDAKSGRFIRTITRVVILQDLQCASNPGSPMSALKWTDVFSSTNNVMGNQTYVHQEINPNTIGRYRILKDRTFTMDNTDPVQNHVMTIGNAYKDIRFNGTAYNAIQKYPIFILYATCSPSSQFVAEGSTGSSTSILSNIIPGSVTWNARVVYNDD